MIKKDFEALLRERFETYLAGYTKTQKEYALNENAFDNFNRLATQLNLSREQVLMVYLQKHLDGITSYINGHKSQRESLHGRVQDAVMYLMLFDGMVTEDELLDLKHENTSDTELEHQMRRHEDAAFWNMRRQNALEHLISEQFENPEEYLKPPMTVR